METLWKMRLNLVQYNSLQLHQKAILLGNGALFVDHHFGLDIIYTLFYYNRYFIEVTVEAATNNLMNIVAFKKGSKFDKYLDDVSLDELWD